MPRTPSRWYAEGVLLLITLIWGGTFAAVKGALELVSPFLFTGIRFLAATVIMGLIWRGSFHRWEPRVLQYGLILGALLAGGFLLQTLGLVYTSASRSAFITGTTVVLVPLLQWLFQRRATTALEWFAAAVALIGLWQLSNPRFESWNPGDVLTAASTLFWAAYIVALDGFTKAMPGTLSHSARLTILQFAVTAAAGFFTYGLTALMGLSTPEPSLSWQPKVIVALAYTTILASVLAMLLQTHYQRYTTPVRATFIYALEPVFASIIAWIVLQERLSPSELFGAGLIVSGSLLAQLPRRRAPAPAEL